MQCENKITKSTAATHIRSEVRNTLLPNGISGIVEHLGKNIHFSVENLEKRDTALISVH